MYSPFALKGSANIGKIPDYQKIFDRMIEIYNIRR